MLISDVRASVFRASGGLKPSIFLDYGLQASSGMAKFASDEWAGGPGSVPDSSLTPLQLHLKPDTEHIGYKKF